MQHCWIFLRRIISQRFQNSSITLVKRAQCLDCKMFNWHCQPDFQTFYYGGDSILFQWMLYRCSERYFEYSSSNGKVKLKSFANKLWPLHKLSDCTSANWHPSLFNPWCVGGFFVTIWQWLTLWITRIMLHYCTPEDKVIMSFISLSACLGVQ